MKATVIVDNIPHQELDGEWGLSIYIEYADKKILLDVGASDLFLENAKKLDIDPEKIDMAVLSHAHYDHAGGMEDFFRKNSSARFYLRKSSEENCYHKVLFFPKYIGIPKHILRDFSERIIMTEGDYTLSAGAYLIPHKTPDLDQIGRREKMYRKMPDGWKPDDFSHEQSLVFETKKGLVIFNSCCHGGAANIINEVASTFPGRKVFGLIGGFHLYNKSDEEIREFAEKVKETGIEFLCTGHCTGKHGFEVLQRELRGVGLQQLRSGLVLEF